MFTDYIFIALTIAVSSVLFHVHLFYLYFFQDYVKSVTTEGTNAAHDMDPENDASLGSQGNHEALLDITRSPLADFHCHERSHFEKSIQVNYVTRWFGHLMIY